ncbi:uncharacterized protein PGTG_11342 [Puccinia graminis f. sp. tritici CRL 75-36-700-3]|uniref:Uncharacterized protein n=1 Tax=Puccinia graminis f. sp. tritici (strain CRL 75-36-700-3 / race SCCL) TaxID=418459 RepID=E3KLJ8_PUCGT|nr:uncharacterized protein PGTG_11342 [Puccinia graminis f. sp. tritici CRL 75-36-700-3]EFP85173.1 hypothetical protein PGTG_11342 [Puccinia graminis f. sp. tritici CRL 75-36-700-3]
MATEVVRESKILLTPDNYALWLLPMKAKLHKAKSLTIVTGIHTCPDPETDKENTKLYVKLNKDAVRLKSGCENPFAEWRRVWWSCKLCPSILSDNKTHQAQLGKF